MPGLQQWRRSRIQNTLLRNVSTYTIGLTSIVEDGLNLTFRIAELLSWLCGFDYTEKHESTLRQRKQTTGDWLFKEELYADWRRGSVEFIWLHGKGMCFITLRIRRLTSCTAGAGKSVLAYAPLFMRSYTTPSRPADLRSLMTFRTDCQTTKH